MSIIVDQERLARVKTLKKGSHESFSKGACIMEAAAYIAREKFSDHPECACPVIGAFLRYRGHSLNSTDPEELAAAKTDAIAAKQHLKAYISAPVKAQLISGDVWLAQLWNGDTAQARAEQPNLAYVIPKEGCTIWGDSMAVPVSARNKRAAHEWMNYILRPEVGAALSEATGYGTPNAASAKLMKDPAPYPTEDELRRLEYQVDLGRDTAVWDQLWTEIKSA